MKTCAKEGCNNPLPPERKKYCSDECQRLAYNARRCRSFDRDGKCRYCKEPFQKTCSSNAYCCPEHKSLYERKTRRLNAQNECRQCGKAFTIDAAHKAYCPECAEHPDPVREKLTQFERKQHEREVADALKEEASRTQVLAALLAAQEKVSGWQPQRFIVPPEKSRYSPEQANIIFSDWHTAELVRAEETGGIAEYNIRIQKERLKRCVKAQAEIVDIHNRGGIKVEHCNVWFLGDMVTGEKVYKGQYAYIEEFTADQVVRTKNLIGETLLNMLDIYKTITCRCVIGNHGRMGEKGEGPTWNNFDYLLYKWTPDLLQNYPQIKWEVSKAPFLLAEIGGWRFCAQHGDDIRGWAGIPYYGYDRDVTDMTAMLWDVEERPPQYWLYAHIHTAEQAELKHGERIINGSPVGGTLYSVKKIKRVSRPSQSFFGLSTKRGITWRYNLYLD